MSVAFFRHQEVAHEHELRALLTLAQALRQRFGYRDEHVALAAAVNFQGGEADALILTERAVILVEFKDCADQVLGGENGPWRIGAGRTLQGGRYPNPFQQIQAYRLALIGLLFRRCDRFLDPQRVTALRDHLHQVNALLLFSPSQHPDNQIQLPAGAYKWLRVGGLDEAAEAVWTCRSRVRLRRDEMERLLAFLNCRPWDDIPVAPTPVGTLTLLDAEGKRLRSKAVSDRMTIGRRWDCDLVIPGDQTRVSRQHATLRVYGEVVRLIDSRSTHGTFVAGERIDQVAGRALNHGDILSLGSATPRPKAAQILFERSFSPGEATV